MLAIKNQPSKVWHINWENSADSSASADKTFLIKNLDEFYLVCTMSSVRNISKFYKYYGQIGYNNVVKSHSTFLKAQKPRSSKQIQKKSILKAISGSYGSGLGNLILATLVWKFPNYFPNCLKLPRNLKPFSWKYRKKIIFIT